MSNPSTNGAAPNSAKKRKAREMQGEPERGRSRKRITEATPINIPPFTVECPAKVRSETDDAFQGHAELAPGFDHDYTIRPGREWKKEGMKSYRNVKYQEQTFSIGDVIYVNRQTNPPPPLGSDATEEQQVEFDRENYWVARIGDARAENANNVYILVNWLYWPEELPMGRQPYHSKHELIFSNAMDIIDATTISSLADVSFWDEFDENAEGRSDDRFWRQTFDVAKLGKDKKGGLSELRKHCRCRRSHNPDRTMYHCTDTSCNTWNHEECLIEEILRKAWPKYQDGTIDEIETDSDTIEIGGVGAQGLDSKSITSRIMSPMRQVAKMFGTKLEEGVEAVAEESLPHPVAAADPVPTPTPVKKNAGPLGKSPSAPSSSRGKSKSRPTKGAKPKALTGEDVLSVTISELREDGPLIAEIRELLPHLHPPLPTTVVKDEGQKVKRRPTSRVWRTKVSCLKCNRFF